LTDPTRPLCIEDAAHTLPRTHAHFPRQRVSSAVLPAQSPAEIG
jgi:hypothetical protein